MKKKDRCAVTAADRKYFPALIALLRSLKDTNPKLPVIVFDGGLTKGQARKAALFAEVVPKVPSIKVKGRGKFSYIGGITLLKLEVGEIDFEKVLYLDADMIVLENLDPLFSFPEGTVGVVEETNSVKNMFRLQHRDLLTKNTDQDLEKKGFNAGLFALRPDEWPDLTEKARGLIDRFGEDVFSKSKDQQLLNMIFCGKTHSFDGKYNFSPFYDDTEECRPAIIHYLSRCKPWHYDYPPGRWYGEFRRNISVKDFPGIVFLDAHRKLKSLSLKRQGKAPIIVL